MNRYRTVRSFPAKAAPVGADSGLHAEANKDLLSSLLAESQTEAPAAPTSTDAIDVCAFLFEGCKQWQRLFLDEAGLTCMFDCDAGRLPEMTCEKLGGLIRNRFRNIASRTEGPGGTITLTLRRRGNLWALAIADQHVRRVGPRLGKAEMVVMRGLAA